MRFFIEGWKPLSKKLIKSSKNQSLHGVCGGIAEYIGLYPMAIRLVFIATFPVSIFVYIILANSLDHEIPSDNLIDYKP